MTFEDIIDKFEEANPNITVEYIAATNFKVDVSICKCQEPTVSLMDPINIWRI